MEDKKMKETKRFNRKALVGGIVMAAIVVGMILLYGIFRPKAVEGSKEITIEVVNNKQESVTYELKTDAEYLRQAMEEAEGLTFSGTESQYGLMVESVNGVVADYSVDGGYWSFYVNDDYCMNGIDTQPVYDKDAFLIKYETSMVE